MSEIDLSKPVQTRDGLKAGIYSTENGGSYPVHGWLEGKEGRRWIVSWSSDGRYFQDLRKNDHDLVNIPELDLSKTVREWLETLPDGYRERALKNMRSEVPLLRRRSLRAALIKSFDWQLSPEGHAFWRSVADGELPPLPVERKPYTQETFPLWAVWIKTGSGSRTTVREVVESGVYPSTCNYSSYDDIADKWLIAGVDGVWHKAYEGGEEVK